MSPSKKGLHLSPISRGRNGSKKRRSHRKRLPKLPPKLQYSGRWCSVFSSDAIALIARIFIRQVRRKSRATRTALQEMSGFEGVVRRQYEKLKIAEHLQPVAQACPLCETPSERGVAIRGVAHVSLAAGVSIASLVLAGADNTALGESFPLQYKTPEAMHRAFR